ncbi:proteasome subunit beta type-10 isoform X1 [Epinephelus fuscoguttatus]|uniref:proteasome subunit beta type-10 isoform X1 n=1 Tax=Epinephelus fuscoguttatus TaxID=293821 RepID=UPI0020D08B82|nr:proteasome subunit beta type-10 isoform X1 [Epinephelus fuscoguttatus]
MLHSLKLCKLQNGGFCFENSRRNAVLESSLSEFGYKAPSARKTGTTIAGIVYKTVAMDLPGDMLSAEAQDGVILGADTRATDDMVVADKNCMKIHYIAPKIYCCGAGVAADAEITTQIMASNVELHMLNTGRPPLVAMVTRQLKQMLFRYQGHVGSSLIVGGVDVTGAHLFSVYPHGSYDKLPFLTMGSGAAAAVSVFEDRFKPNMELEEAKQLVRDAIAAGIFCDLGSGSNVDLCVITEAEVEYLRSYDKPTTKGKREGQYRYKPGTTAVLTKTVTPFSLDVVEESVQIMDTE